MMLLFFVMLLMFIVVSQISTAVGKSELPVDGCIPTARNEFLFFSLQADADKIVKFFDNSKTDNKNIVFIRSGVAAGKTTMADHLNVIDDRFVLIDGPADYHDVKEWTEEIRKAHDQLTHLNTNKTNMGLGDLLHSFSKHQKVLIFDEAHHTFRCKYLMKKLYKDKKGPDVLLFSSCASAGKEGTTPSEIDNKLTWITSTPEPSTVSSQLSACEVQLDERAVKFVFDFCAGHFGVIIRALEWIKNEQAKNPPIKRWDYTTTVNKVRESMRGGWRQKGSVLERLSKSRAIKVNGQYAW